MSEQDRAKPLVLVADDDAGARLLVSSALEGGGMEVLTAEDAEEAERLIHAHHPVCAVLDVVMPGMSGLQLCRRLRDDAEFKHLPVLVMTSLDDFESIDEAYASGATDFSPKGISPRILVERVRFMLRAKADRDRLVQSESRLESAQRMARVGHVQWSASGQPLSVSSTVREIFGVNEAFDFTQNSLVGFVHPEDKSMVAAAVAAAKRDRTPMSIEHRIVGLDGVERVVIVDAQYNEIDGKRDGAVLATVQDVTEHRRAESRAKYLTYIDELTGLPNRTLLRETIEGLVAKGSDHTPFAILVLDLNEFRRFNESLGQAAGDELLRSVAARIQRVIRDNDIYGRDVLPRTDNGVDTVGRLGGDEFVLVATRVSNSEQARYLGRRIQEQLRDAFEIGGNLLHVSLKIGISLAPRDGTDTEVLLTKASAAAAIAKDGEDGIQFYDEDFNLRAKRRLSLEQALRKAVGSDQFELHYQPRINVAGGALAGAEALIRWNHPELGRIPPDEFISLAEQLNLIEPIGEWVLRTAAHQLASWLKAKVSCNFISVNLSPLQLRNDKHMLRTVVDTISKAGIQPENLELEITEGILIRQPQGAIRFCTDLKAMGIGVALDDFGTGYSALGYLRRFPVSAIKIDRSFINDVASARESQAIVRSILALSQGLRLATVAEGVETLEQAEFLFQAGCEQIQGYLYSKPLPATEFEIFSRTWRAPNRELLKASRDVA